MLTLDETMVYSFKELAYSKSHTSTLQSYTEYKFGVLYYRDAQVNEDDMFGNVDTSPEYEDFLALLGQKVRVIIETGY